MFHCLHIVSNWHKGFGLANSVKTIWCWLRARLSQCLTTSGWNCPSLQYPFQTSNNNMDVCVLWDVCLCFSKECLLLVLAPSSLTCCPCAHLHCPELREDQVRRRRRRQWCLCPLSNLLLKIAQRTWRISWRTTVGVPVPTTSSNCFLDV